MKSPCVMHCAALVIVSSSGIMAPLSVEGLGVMNGAEYLVEKYYPIRLVFHG